MTDLNLLNKIKTNLITKQKKLKANNHKEKEESLSLMTIKEGLEPIN